MVVIETGAVEIVVIETGVEIIVAIANGNVAELN